MAVRSEALPVFTAQRTSSLGRLTQNRNFVGFWFMLPAAAVLAALPRLSARARRLAVDDRHAHRPRRHLHRLREFSVSLGRQRLLAVGLQHLSLHDRRLGGEVRARPLAGAAPQPPPAVQGVPARHRAPAVDRADGALGHRLLVDLRQPVLDHLLGAGEARPDRHATSTSSAPRTTRARAPSSPTSGAASRSWRSRCSPACRRSRPRSTRRR